MVSHHSSSGKKAFLRLMQIGDGMTWETEMDNLVWESLFSVLYVPAEPVEPAASSSRFFEII